MRVPLGGNGLHRCRERLAENLTTEHGAPAEILALTAEKILFDAFEREEGHELVEDGGHQRKLGSRRAFAQGSPERWFEVDWRRKWGTP